MNPTHVKQDRPDLMADPLRCILITDDDLMDAVISDRPLSRRQKLTLAWSITWRAAVLLAMLVAVVWLAFAIPENL